MKTRVTRLAATVLSTSALVLGAHAAFAQNSAAQADAAAMPQAQASQMQVDEKTVNNFVEAYTEVRDIHSEYAQKLQQVEDQQQASAIQQEAQKKMEEAVTSNNISVEEYMRIAQQIGQDPELRSRIQQELQASTGN